LTYKVEEAATLVAYTVEDLGETKKTLGLLMVGIQLSILLFEDHLPRFGRRNGQ